MEPSINDQSPSPKGGGGIEDKYLPPSQEQDKQEDALSIQFDEEEEDELEDLEERNPQAPLFPRQQPHTPFPKNSSWNLGREDEIILRWEKEGVFQKAATLNKTKQSKQGGNKFVIHDGPPYANGDIHLGHILNKVLKDVIGKFKRQSGFHVSFLPGFDCHGLPNELFVARKLREERGELNIENPEDLLRKQKMNKKEHLEFLQHCRNRVSIQVDAQVKAFKKFGVLADWENRYETMSFVYQSSILHGFANFVEKGYIKYSAKTTPWCSTCQTSLAHAEMKKIECEDPSILLLFPLKTKADPGDLSLLFDVKFPGPVKEIGFLVSVIFTCFSVGI